MYSAIDARLHVYADALPVPCKAAASQVPLAAATRPPVSDPLAYCPYDADTLDALMLFHTPTIHYAHPHSHVYTSSYAGPSHQQRREHTAKRAHDEETRRAMHREVQRRFVKRKQAEFTQLRSYARKLELHHKTLLLRAQADVLSDEHTWLQRKIEVAEAQQDDDEKDEKDETDEKDEKDEKDDDETEDENVRRKHDLSSPLPHRARPRRLFSFDLSSGDP